MLIIEIVVENVKKICLAIFAMQKFLEKLHVAYGAKKECKSRAIKENALWKNC